MHALNIANLDTRNTRCSDCVHYTGKNGVCELHKVVVHFMWICDFIIRHNRGIVRESIEVIE